MYGLVRNILMPAESGQGSEGPFILRDLCFSLVFRTHTHKLQLKKKPKNSNKDSCVLYRCGVLFLHGDEEYRKKPTTPR